MVLNWIDLILGRGKNNVKSTEAESTPLCKLTKILDMVRDGRSRFSRSQTLDTIDNIEAALTERELNGKQGALVRYIRGHIHALDGDWDDAMQEWGPVDSGGEASALLDEEANRNVAWGRVMQAYTAEEWSSALTGFDTRLAKELAAGNTKLMDTWRLQVMRGWCLAHLKQHETVEALTTALMTPGPDEDERLQMYASELTEPLRFLSFARLAKDDVEGALRARWAELDILEGIDSAEFEFSLAEYVLMASNKQQWNAAHEGYERFAHLVSQLRSDHQRERAQSTLEKFTLYRVSWPKK